MILKWLKLLWWTKSWMPYREFRSKYRRTQETRHVIDEALDGRLVRIEIEDTSDCETCERRHKEQFDLIVHNKCDLLTDLKCPECGREFGLFFESTKGGGDARE